MKNDYYILESGEPLKVFNELLEKGVKLRRRAMELGKTLNATRVYGNLSYLTSFSGGLSAFGFKRGEAPSGWVEVKNATYEPGEVAMRPSKRKAHKAIFEQMESIRPDSRESDKLFKLFGADLVVDGRQIATPVAGHVGKTPMVVVPRLDSAEPATVDGARRILKWEYNKMCHEAEEEK